MEARDSIYTNFYEYFGLGELLLCSCVLAFIRIYSGSIYLLRLNSPRAPDCKHLYNCAIGMER